VARRATAERLCQVLAARDHRRIGGRGDARHLDVVDLVHALVEGRDLRIHEARGSEQHHHQYDPRPAQHAFEHDDLTAGHIADDGARARCTLQPLLACT
jgi:hypothetical protein